jgi:hypothetical protein
MSKIVSPVQQIAQPIKYPDTWILSLTFIVKAIHPLYNSMAIHYLKKSHKQDAKFNLQFKIGVYSFME